MAQWNNGIEEPPGPERLISFSDPIFAFAITLLAMSLVIPPHLAPAQLPGSLLALEPGLVTYAISYIMISLYWLLHHRMFHHIKRTDTPLLVLNLLFLVSITFMPFLTALAVNYRHVQLAAVTYAVSLAIMSMLVGAIWLYATHHHSLVNPDLHPWIIRDINLRVVLALAIFLLSIVLSFFNVRVSHYALLLIILIPPLCRILNRPK